MIRTQIQVYADQIEWLKRHALEKGISMSQLIRDSIAYYRSHIEDPRILNSKKEKALKVIGIFTTNMSEADS